KDSIRCIARAAITNVLVHACAILRHCGLRLPRRLKAPLRLKGRATSGRQMKLLRFEYEGMRRSGVLRDGKVTPVAGDLLEIIRMGSIGPAGEPIPFEQVTPLLPYDVPPKIWCIGLNYHSHAEDINAVQPEEPGSFMKPASCMFQPGGNI